MYKIINISTNYISCLPSILFFILHIITDFRDFSMQLWTSLYFLLSIDNIKYKISNIQFQVDHKKNV